ncbi:MAG: penicillin-binding protein [Actinomycetaceae bacterium]|nr:penicillin-binding protein [Actinomycetaceae bacterium]
MASSQNSGTQTGGTTLQQMGRILLVLTLLCSVGGALMAGIALPVVTALGTASNALTSSFEEVPSDLGFTTPSVPSVLLASDGSELARFYAENRVVVGFDDVSQHMKDAVVAVEDRRFYNHHGIDVRGLLGAFVTNISGDTVSGGSSITQQYVKNALMERGRIAGDDKLIDQATERTITRKVNEARFAIAVEKTMTKDQILTGYLNLVSFGPSVYGVEAAAQHYFSKSSKDLTIAESALLAGVTQNPAHWDPEAHPEAAQGRRDEVLSKMHRDGYISDEELDVALATPVDSMLHISNPPTNGCEAAGISAYFCEYVVKDVLRDDALGETSDERIAKLYRGGLRIHTTIDPAKQKIAYDVLTQAVPPNDASRVQTALSNVEPTTGKILAMSQNTNYGVPSDIDPTATKVNLNVSQAMGGGSGFQTGSTFKIFTLVEWLKQGHSIREALYGGPGTIGASQWTISCAPQEASSWQFKNDSNLTWGTQTVANGTKYSINGVYARMAQQLDICNIAQTATDMGVETGDGSNLDHFPPMILGTNTLTPLSMAEATATLANKGVHCEPISYTKIEDQGGELIATRESQCERVVDEGIAAQATEALKTVLVSGGSGTKAYVSGITGAGKTGTTDSAWHTWFVGYEVPTAEASSRLATAVWVGHMDGNIPLLNVRVNGVYYKEVHGGDIAATEYGTYTRRALGFEVPVPKSKQTKAPQPKKQSSANANAEQEAPAQQNPENNGQGGAPAADQAGGQQAPANPPAPEQ